MTESHQDKILVVDDYTPVKNLIKDILEGMGFSRANLHEASTGEEGLEKVRGGDYGLVISDWELPGMDGMCLLRAIRAEESTRRVPFLMITGGVVQRGAAEAIHAGATAYLLKPFSPAELVHKVLTVFPHMEEVPAAGTRANLERTPSLGR